MRRSSNTAPLMREFLFPTSVWYRDLPNLGALNRKLLVAIEQLRRKDAGVTRSNFLGWHSDTKLHEEPKFAAIRRHILAAARAVLISLDAGGEVGVELTECWANINIDHAHNHRHCHPGDDLSGVYYVQAEESSGPLVFFDPRPGNNLFTPVFGRNNVGFCKKVEYGAKAGRIVMFPGWLEHAVEANHGAGERVSIAFNLKLAGKR
jgi:uncharacterized protein (TIGR02466 family)